MAKNKITIGILAHVDAGKTSLTECLLYASGATSSRGSVDKGSAITDGLQMEKDRGISIQSATVDFTWNDTLITLVDTPGHIDFSAEVDRALSVLDMVILVVSAKEGIQAYTMNLWENLQERQLPVLVFVNKIDRDGVDLEAVFKGFETDLGGKLFALNYPLEGSASEEGLLDFNQTHAHLSEPILDKSLENLAELDEAFLDQYLEGDLTDLDQVLNAAKGKIQSRELIGVLFGSAKLDVGISPLLEAITALFPGPLPHSQGASAKVFKVSYDSKWGRLAHIRSYGSALKSKDVLWSQGLESEFKINQLFTYRLGQVVQIDALASGEFGLLTTSELIPVGDVLGEPIFDDTFNRLSPAVLTVQVEAEADKDYQALGQALEILNVEDPQLDLQWYKDKREFHLRIHGPIQTEVLRDSLFKRFSLAARFLSPQVIYKETPTSSAEGYIRYWMPKPCWAILTFYLEPGVRGGGVVFESKVRTNDISQKYQNEVARAIPWSMKQGIKGWEVTDLKVTLIEGSEHTVHSNPGDFLLATPMGVLKGLEHTGTTLLEPIYAFQIKAQADLLGAVSSDLHHLNAQIDAPLFSGDFFTLTGRVPVAKAMDYSIQFNATTSGKGRLKLTLDGYEETTTTDDKIRPYQGVSPLDEAQWILHNRGAFKADERR